MKNKHIAFGLVLVLTAVFLPSMVRADDKSAVTVTSIKITSTSDNGVGSSDPSKTATDKTGFQIVSCTGVVDANHPGVECDYNQLIFTVQRIINFAIYIITPIIIVMLIYTGFKYMFANGDVNVVADAKRMFKPIFIGMFFILAAWLIVHTLLDKLLADNVTAGDSSTNPITKQQILGQ